MTDQLELICHWDPVASFRVNGAPVPQGSHTAKIKGVRVKTNRGPAVLKPQPFVVDIQDMATKKKRGGRLKRWREAVARAARVEMRGREPTTRMVMLQCEFVITRPASHWTSTGRLSAAGRRSMSPEGDLAKLVRAVEDSMSAIVYKDDRLVVRYGDVRKRYAGRGESPGVTIMVSEALL